MRRAFLLVLALLALSRLALAAQPAAGVELDLDAGRGEDDSRTPAVELVQPAAGARLAAGSTATIEWRVVAPARLAPAFVEWEAFLSLDGGASYPFRITPHLDRSRRRFTWQVPAVRSGDARILLRFGDERHEREVEPRRRFAIVDAPDLASAPALPAPVLPVMERGEPARAGEPGVVAWVEGTRQGESLRLLQATSAVWRAGEPVLAAALTIDCDAEESSSARPDPPGLVRLPGRFPAAGRGAALQTDLLPARATISILLQTQRLNE